LFDDENLPKFVIFSFTFDARVKLERKIRSKSLRGVDRLKLLIAITPLGSASIIEKTLGKGKLQSWENDLVSTKGNCLSIEGTDWFGHHS